MTQTNKLTIGERYASNLVPCLATLTGAIAVLQADQVAVRSPKEKIENARQLLSEAKKDLMSDGKYNCCIKYPCGLRLTMGIVIAHLKSKPRKRIVRIATLAGSGVTEMSPESMRRW